MTPSECANGTERCAAVVDALDEDIDYIVNFQGDAPLTPASMVEALVQCISNEEGVEVATPAIPCAGSSLDHLLEEQRQGRVGGTTLVFDRRGRALYFSKSVIPHGASRQVGIHVWLHLGIYVYTRSALANYRQSPPSQAELAEGLEQLRFLDQGITVRIVTCPAPEGTMVELNNPEDVAVIEQELQRRLQR
jgi:3-deoxy-manno-octulosonate cytidylyltransferase (CMP-KDO synthetase)